MRHLLFKQVDIASLVFFRILFGILAFGEACGVFIYHHLTKNHFEYGAFHFKYQGLEWVNPLPEPFMSMLFVFMMISAVCIVIGYRYKLACLIYAFGFFWVFYSEASLYLNHGYLFSVLCFYMVFTPSNRSFSADVLRKPRLYVSSIPYYYILVLLLMMGTVYFFGGIAKINADWLQAVPMRQWLEYKSYDHLRYWYWLKQYGFEGPITAANDSVGKLLKSVNFAYFISWGGLLFDLTIAFLLAYKPTRKFAFITVVFFHFTNFLIFNIGIFPFLSIGLSALFFSPSFPRTLIKSIGKRTKIVRNWQAAWMKKLRKRQILNTLRPLSYSYGTKRMMTIALSLFMLYMVIMPLRHWLYKSDVAWTEEGHRFAWRMMLRSKSGFGTFTVRDSGSDKKEKVDPKKWLNKRQARKLYGHPGMIWQFANYLAQEYTAKGWTDPQVYPNISLRLNNRKVKRYISPETDLTKVKWNWFNTDMWVLPPPEWQIEKKDE